MQSKKLMLNVLQKSHVPRLFSVSTRFQHWKLECCSLSSERILTTESDTDFCVVVVKLKTFGHRFLMTERKRWSLKL